MEAVQHTHDLVAARIRIRKSPHRNVDIKDREEMTMWCRRLGVTPFQLCSVVDRVGNEVASVRNALRVR
jgi:hypothetical protein